MRSHRTARRYLALIEYDGTAYYGFQRQRKSQPTIQGEIERALTRLTNQTIPVTGSGRTDRGVHATGQVISFAIEWQHGTETLQRALNANLPVDIVVLQLDVADSNFHPRFDAKSRAYKYYIYNQTNRSPLYGRYTWHVRKPLNIDKMNMAATALIGTHDFATFGTPPQGNSTTRTLLNAHWSWQDKLLVFDIEANAFLYRMVRSIVGSLKLVGDETWTIDEFEAAFKACDRDQCGTVAPPQGLYLTSVKYGETSDQ